MSITLNAAPISFGHDQIEVGFLPDKGKEANDVLRDAHRGTHVFRFDRRYGKIANVGLDGASPLGAVRTRPVDENLFLAGHAIQRQVVDWLSRRYTVLRDLNPVVFWAAASRHKLLSRSVRDVTKKAGRPIEPVDGLDVFVRFRLSTRLLYPRGNQPTPYLGLLLDIHTSNVIDLPVGDLLSRGLDPRGMYVGQRGPQVDDVLLPELDILGRVREVDGDRLLLDDLRTPAEEGQPPATSIPIASALVEPRGDNLESVARVIYGGDTDAILRRLRQLRHSYATAPSQLDHIRTTLKGLRKNVDLDVAGVGVTIGDLLARGDDLFPLRISTSRPTCFFGPQGRKTGKHPDTGVSTHGPFQYMLHETNEPLLAVVCEATQRVRVQQFVAELRDGFSDAEWKEATKRAYKRKENPYSGGLLGKYHLRRVRDEYEEVPNRSSEAYRAAIRRLLGRLPRLPDLALVQIRAEDREKKGDENPYFVAKAEFMAAGVPVQAVQAEKIEYGPRQLPYLLNNVALASYAKLGGTPWVLSTKTPGSREVVVGIGYTESFDRRLGPRKRYVGITTFFQGNGRYLAWGTTRDVEFEGYAEALLDSLRNTVRHVEAENEWEPGDRVRLVFHVYKPLKRVEIESVRALVEGMLADRYQVEFAFLTLSSWHDYCLFDPDQEGALYYPPDRRGTAKKGVGVAERGLCFQLDPRRALLQLTGPRELKTDLDGVPRPMLVEVHRDSDVDDLTYLVRQVFHFSFLSWRSFFPADAPVTILYSKWIAQRLADLRSVDGWDSRAVTTGALRDSKWFL